MTTKARKRKHGQRIVTYTLTDFAARRDGITSDTYIQPSVTIASADVNDVLEDYRRYGGQTYLERADRLRNETGDTLHAEPRYYSDQIVIRWQSDRQSADTPLGYSYQPFYASKVDGMGLELGLVATLTKILKSCQVIDCGPTGTDIRPTTMIAALNAIGAVRVEWSKHADAWIFARDNAFDGWFNLAPEIRQGYVAPVEAETAA